MTTNHIDIGEVLKGQSFDSDFVKLMVTLQRRYPPELFNLDGIGVQLDINGFSKQFFTAKVAADASIDANANVEDTSNIAYTTEIVKPWHRLNSYYKLYQMLKKTHGRSEAAKVIEDQFTGAIYINDFHGLAAATPYCFNYSTYDIMLQGLPMVKKVKSLPPKYLYSFKSQLEQFIVIASNSTLGATGLADLFIVMSYYVKKILTELKDGHFSFSTTEDAVNYIKETLVSFIYTINQPFRAGLQSPFVNVSVYDSHFLEQMCSLYLFPDDTYPDIKTVQWLQRVYIELMNGEMRRTPITFPVTTACFVTDEQKNIIDKDFLQEIAHYNSEFGFINFYFGKSSTLSSCCRLRSDSENEYFNSFGAGATKIGSLGVVTINLPQLAEYAIASKPTEHSPWDEFVHMARKYVEVCAQINNAKRTLISKRIETGSLPLYSFGFMDLNKQYSTCGINGLNEALEILGFDITKEAGIEATIELLDAINEVNAACQVIYGAPHNCEQIPGENSSIKLAQKDKLLGYNHKGYALYSNQFIPLHVDADLLSRIIIQGKFDGHFTGGAICHLNVEERIEDPLQIVELMEAAARCGVVYTAINYCLCECGAGHFTVGNGVHCSICGSTIVNRFTRVVGFLTNITNWHKVRRETDFPSRVWKEIQ